MRFGHRRSSATSSGSGSTSMIASAACFNTTCAAARLGTKRNTPTVSLHPTSERRLKVSYIRYHGLKGAIDDGDGAEGGEGRRRAHAARCTARAEQRRGLRRAQRGTGQQRLEELAPGLPLLPLLLLLLLFHSERHHQTKRREESNDKTPGVGVSATV